MMVENFELSVVSTSLCMHACMLTTFVSPTQRLPSTSPPRLLDSIAGINMLEQESRR